MSTKIQAVRGMNDVLPEEALWWQAYEATVEAWLARYGYRNIRMPLVEHTQLFRRERPQKGRYRQFFQIGAEAIGSESPAVDAEVIEMLVSLLDRLHLSGYTLLLTSVGCAECRPV